MRSKKLGRFFCGEREGLLDRKVAVAEGQNLRLPAQTIALLASHIGRGEKTHLNPYGSSSITRGAPTWTCVMGKVGGSES